MASSPREPVLKLETITSGTPITIDGRPFEIRHPLALSLGALKRLTQLGLDIDAIENKARQGPITPEEESRWSALLRELGALVLDAPADVRESLTDVQVATVVHVFTGLRSQTRTTAASARPSTGPKSSRGSRGSTAARRTNGTGVFRPLSSKRT
jgi:hypothetical protein